MNSLQSQINVWAKSSYGIVIHEHQMKRIAYEVDQLKDAMQYNSDAILQAIEKKDQSITQALVNAITVQESYFFRDESFFNMLKTVFFPDLVKLKESQGDLTLRIWSAGCACGEEIYSIAILCKELFADNEAWRIELLATDINEEALEKARTAAYTKSSMRMTSDYLRKRYFTEKDKLYFLNDDIKKKVVFKYHNVVDELYPSGMFDLIVCRNVFIYLDKPSIEHALSKFYQCLGVNGRIFLGPSDFVTYYDHDLKMHFDRGVTYFTRHEEESKENAALTKLDSFIGLQSNAAEELARIKEDLSIDARKALIRIDAFSSKPSALLYQYKAQALMALNDIDTACEVCDMALTIDPSNYGCCIIKGLIYMEKGDKNRSRSYFNKAMLSKPEAVEACYYLAKLEMSDGAIEVALSYFNKAVDLSKRKSQYAHLIGFEGKKIYEFIDSMKKDINYLERKLHE